MLLCWDSCSAPLPIVHFRWHHLSGRSWRDTHHASQIGWGKGLIYFLYITLTYTLLLTIQPPCFLAAAWVSEAAASITGRRGASCLTHPSLLSISQGRRGPLLAVWPETERSQGLTTKTSQWKLGDELCLCFFFFFFFFHLYFVHYLFTVVEELPRPCTDKVAIPKCRTRYPSTSLAFTFLQSNSTKALAS